VMLLGNVIAQSDNPVTAQMISNGNAASADRFKDCG